MATIVSRRRGDGSIAHMARIIVKRKGKVAFKENRTFDRKQAAYAWAEAREKELSAPGGLDKVLTGHVLLGDVIDKYIDTSLRKIGRTKAQVLRSIKAHPLADMECSKVGSADIVAFATELATTRKPQTVANYLSHLAAVFAVARPAWGFPLDQQAVLDAMKVTKRLGLTSKSAMRDRRPSLDELDRLLQHFSERKVRTPQAMPMHTVIAFALFSTRRQEEITRIRWDDLDETHKRIMVRDMKNPGEKQGNNVWCDLPDPALDIIRAMPRRKAEIFPYSTDAITANFTRACKVLGIDDLHFHDLRHEGVSRLFEVGYGIAHAATVSGHRSWSSLKRYTHIRQSGDKYEDWKWLPVVTAIGSNGTGTSIDPDANGLPANDDIALAALEAGDPVAAGHQRYVWDGVTDPLTIGGPNDDLWLPHVPPVTLDNAAVRAPLTGAVSPIHTDPLMDAAPATGDPLASDGQMAAEDPLTEPLDPLDIPLSMLLKELGKAA